MPASKGTIFLGVPPSLILDDQGRNHDCSVDAFLPAFRRFLGTLDASAVTSSVENVLSSSCRMRWREITYRIDSGGTGDGRHWRPGVLEQIISTHDDDFLEHSFAILDLPDSHIQPRFDIDGAQDNENEQMGEDTTIGTATSASIDSSLMDTSLSTTTISPERQTATITLSGPITSILSLPKAAHLRYIRPQTMTVTLLCGVISISTPRKVFIKRGGGYEMDIVELVVGDETRAGLSITVWLSPVADAGAGAGAVGRSQTRSQTRARGLGIGPVPRPGRDSGPAQRTNRARELDGAFRSTIQSLRPGDVVLVENLALAEYRDVVFGQSLNRRVEGVRTRFSLVQAAGHGHVLGRVPSGLGTVVLAGSGSESATDVVQAKLERVLNWVETFVGIGPKSRKRLRGANAGGGAGFKATVDYDEETLPPDTP